MHSKKVSECYCELCSRVYPQILDLHNTFEDIIIGNHDFSDDFCKLFKSLISLDVCFDSGYFINMQKAKLYRSFFSSSEIQINFLGKKKKGKRVIFNTKSFKLFLV